MTGAHTHITLKDALIALTIIAGWSFNIVIIRIGATEMEPLFLLFLRYALGYLIFLPFIKIPNLQTALNLSLYALFYVIMHLGLLFVASMYLQASLVGLILQTGMPFALLIGFFLHGEKFGPATALGILFAFGGVFIILYEPIENFSYIGAFLVLASAFCWAFGSFLMRRVQDVDLFTMTAISYGVAFPVIGTMSFMIEDNQVQRLVDADLPWVGFIVFYQIILMSLALYFWKGLMSRNPAHELTAFLVLQPLFVVLFGWVLLGEILGPREILGGSVLLLGVAIITIRNIMRPKHLPEEITS